MKLQYSLLTHATNLLNKNGSITYSTCSLNHEENWYIINKFLKENINFKIDNASNYIPKEYVDNKGALKIMPDVHKMMEGMFAVKLISI